jgi:hypothetical protein
MAVEYISGPTMVLQWIYSGGTISFNQDYRTASWSPSVEMVDATAGADTVRKRLTSFKDASASISLVDQTNAAGTASALDAGVSGTLIIGPEGTASGKRKITMPAFSQGAKYNFPFDNIAELTCDFMANGAYTDGTY